MNFDCGECPVVRIGEAAAASLTCAHVQRGLTGLQLLEQGRRTLCRVFAYCSPGFPRPAGKNPTIHAAKLVVKDGRCVHLQVLCESGQEHSI